MDNKLEQLANRIRGLLEQEAVLSDVLGPNYTVNTVSMPDHRIGHFVFEIRTKESKGFEVAVTELDER